jgi:aminotransferase in exopolysaccharide biosynthesis
MRENLVGFIQDYYGRKDFIALHEPAFVGKEIGYVVETITSTFVSSVGKFVDQFEDSISSYTGSSAAIATVNGTAAIHSALLLAGVKDGQYVVTQALTFVATANAIKYCGADPIFIDVDTETLGLSPVALEEWLEEYAFIDDNDVCRVKADGKVIAACLPMHTFGHPVRLSELVTLCSKWHLPLVEDAAESLGSLYKGKHTGTYGDLGAISFNGNKIITAGGGGIILCNKKIAKKAKHLTTTAKKAHKYEFFHDELAFNYRLPNLNAALGLAQLESIEYFLAKKRELAMLYKDQLSGTDYKFVSEPADCRSNYWLNAVICDSRSSRDDLLEITNNANVMTRPIWTLMNRLPMYKNCFRDNLENSIWLESRIVNLPSSVKR